MSQPTIISCALTGGGDTTAVSPHVPVTPAQIAKSLPPGACWSAFGISRHQFPMVAQAVLLGGHVRVGLEDNLYLTRGQLAPGNASLVERAARIVRELDAEVATPAQAREILGLARR